MGIEMVFSGDEFSLLRECSQNCVDNGGEWYSAPQVLAILGDHVSNPALMGDAAFISMAEPECVLRVMMLLDELVETQKETLRMLEAAHRQLGMHSSDNKRVRRAKAAITKATGITP